MSEEVVGHIKELEMLSEYDGETLVSDAENVASEIGELKTAQIRRIFGEVKKMQMDFKKADFDKNRVVLLKPKLAYATSRKRDVRTLQEVLSICIDKISADKEQGKKDFENFVNFFEAIVAYHRGR